MKKKSKHQRYTLCGAPNAAPMRLRMLDGQLSTQAPIILLTHQGKGLSEELNTAYSVICEALSAAAEGKAIVPSSN